MNVRHFTRASSEWIDTNVGNAPVFGPATILALVKKSTDTSNFEYIYMAGATSDPNNWQFYVGLSGDNKPAIWTGAANVAATFTALVSENWMILGCTKATGTSALRFHKYVLDTGLWTHADSSTAANSGTPVTRNVLGNSTGHGATGWDGHILAIGVWNVVLSDAAIEAISPAAYADFGALITGWLATATAPRVLNRFDQATAASTVTDETGGGADSINRNGTSVVTNDDPTFGPLASTAVTTYYRHSIGSRRPIVYDP